jgi:hypothetical protein
LFWILNFFGFRVYSLAWGLEFYLRRCCFRSLTFGYNCTMTTLGDNHFIEQCALGEKCPLLSVHSRLQEVCISWKHARDTYDQPVEFRTHLNACIQALRSTTWVLQKQKGRFKAFDEWYSKWQLIMKNDAILKWLVDARNRIVKEGDLSTQSLANISLIKSYSDPPNIALTVNPLLPTLEIAQLFLATKPANLDYRNGFIRVERRWVANDLPDFELLEGLARAYRAIAILVNDAHGQLSEIPIQGHILADATIKDNPLLNSGTTVLDYLAEDSEYRAVCVRIDTGDIMKLRIRDVKIDPKADNYILTHYGFDPNKDKLCQSTDKSLHGMAKFFFECGKRMLEVDGYHLPFVFLFLPNGAMRLCGLKINDITDKYRIWRAIAEEVRRKGATSVIVISESWVAPYDRNNPTSASDSPNRSEALSLNASSASGEEYSLACKFRRVDGKIVFDEDEEDTYQALYLEPVKKVWREQISLKGSARGWMPKKERNIKKKR